MRSRDEILAEKKKVETAKKAAEQKIVKCKKRLKTLDDELLGKGQFAEPRSAE